VLDVLDVLDLKTNYLSKKEVRLNH
jgi:hypothetical protein